MSPQRVVVICPHASHDFLQLPAASFPSDKDFASGGERSLYEIAAAASVAGFEVEIRGDIQKEIFQTVMKSANASPATPNKTRRIDPEEILIFPEVLPIDQLASYALSGATLYLFMLSPIGLISWDGSEDWVQEDILEVPFEKLCQPIGFQSFFQFGCNILTHARGIAVMAKAAGVPINFIGESSPVERPDLRNRNFDVAIVSENRWSGQSEKVLAELEGFSVKKISRIPKLYSLAGELSEAKILIFPSRVEGRSRICREARSVGTVPVVLSTNPFNTVEDWGEGVVFADDLSQMALRIRELLQDELSLGELSRAAIGASQVSEKWEAFISAVKQALSDPVSMPDREFRLRSGEFLENHIQHFRNMAQHSELEKARLEQVLNSTNEVLNSTNELVNSQSNQIDAFRRRKIVRILDKFSGAVHFVKGKDRIEP